MAIDQGWLKELDSIFIGGGTPGLFNKHYDRIFSRLEPHLGENCEVSIECNPNDVTTENLKIWSQLGINRFSIGVQSFSSAGLNFLTRDHTARQSMEAIDKALSFVNNVNVDLIYGWSGQTLDSWRHDLKICKEYSVPHLSCYCLTYEPRTTLGRKASRGVIAVQSEEAYADLYEIARDILSDYEHEEISNWSMRGYSCRHNWAYWSNSSYLAFGVGAHGLLPRGAIGERYHFHQSLKLFIEEPVKNFFANSPSGNAFSFEQRDRESYIIEKIATGFRTRYGCNLLELKKNSGFDYAETDEVRDARERGLIHRQDNMIWLDPEEWIRENYWCGKLLDCFTHQPAQ